jgi:hypothetical protein
MTETDESPCPTCAELVAARDRDGLVDRGLEARREMAEVDALAELRVVLLRLLG